MTILRGGVAIPLITWLFAKQISDISAFLTTIVISVYALAVFGNPAVLGLILALRIAGSVVGAFVASWWARHTALSQILILAELAGAVTIFVLAVSPAEGHKVALLLVVPLIGIFHGIFHVALYSQVHGFVTRENQYRMNGALASMDGVAVVVGGIAASFLYDLLPVRTIFALDAATYVCSAAMFAMFNRSSAKPGLAEAVQDLASERSFAFTRPVLKAIALSAGVLLLARFLEAFGSATHNVGFPILSEQYDEANPAFLIGWVMAIWGLGKIVATFATTPIVLWFERRNIGSDMVFIVFLILTFLFFLGVFHSQGLALSLTFAFLAGVFDASTETIYYSTLQRNTRVQTDVLISMSYSLERLGMGTGILIVGYAYSTVEKAHVVANLFYLGSTACCIVLAVVYMLWRQRISRHAC